MAVLYRSHFHALELQLELTRRNIPFSITSGIRFFEQAHIKDVAAYLKFITNPRDELAFKRIVRLLQGVGAKGADRIWNAFNAAVGAAARPPLAVALQKIAAVVPKKDRRGLGAIHRHHRAIGSPGNPPQSPRA
jgi:DNA helicase-2/ATP-dependent DNA helicase PcrA